MNLKDKSFDALVLGLERNRQMYRSLGDEYILDIIKDYEKEIEAREWAVVIKVMRRADKQWDVSINDWSYRVERYKRDAMAFAKKLSKDYEYFTIEDQKVRA